MMDHPRESANTGKVESTKDKMSSPRGVAGRTNYDEWHKRSKALLQEAEKEDEEETLESKEALGHSRHAFSQAEADERDKLMKAKATKQQLDNHQQREAAGMLTLDQSWLDRELARSSSPGTVQVTRRTFEEADKEDPNENNNVQRRVLCLSHLEGPATIVLSPDLCQLECTSTLPTTKENEEHQPVKVYGIIKLFCSYLSNNIVVKCDNCKIITSHIELSHCSDTTLHVHAKGGQNKISTIQVDLSQRIGIEYLGYDPSRDNTVFGGHKEDKIYHAGVSDLKVIVARKALDEENRLETSADYLRDGAKAEGAATAEEYQFITHVVGGKLVTERLYRMANHKLVTEEELRKEVATKKEQSMSSSSQNEDIYESDHPHAIDGLLTKYQIEDIVKSCEQHKQKGNEAFGSGEYAQAILWYTRAIDESEGLTGSLVKDEEEGSEEKTDTPTINEEKENFFKSRSICYANRSACFLKMGHHEKALTDAERSTELNPSYIKGHFRRGMALHALKRHEEALPFLVKCHKMEPKNKQVKQALQFCEIALQKQHRLRMEGS